MKTFVLILAIMHPHGYTSVTTQEFTSANLCQHAANTIVANINKEPAIKKPLSYDIDYRVEFSCTEK